MFDIQSGKVIESVMRDAKKLKKDKKNVASMTDHSDKQLYYVLTEEQFELIKKSQESTKGGREMKVYQPKTIEESIDNLHQFFECDLYSKFRPDEKIKGEAWTRDDVFPTEKEFLEYLQDHFDLLRKEIKRIKKKTEKENNGK